MTLETTLNTKSYIGNSINREFSIPFSVLEEDHIYLILKTENTSEVITNNYHIDLTDKIVTYPLSGNPLSSSQQLTIFRNVPLTQIVDLENAGAFHPQVLEQDGFDRVVMQIQQVAEEVSRSIKVDINSEQSADELRDAIFNAEATSIAKASQANISAENATISENNAFASASNAKESEEETINYAQIAQNWAIGDIEDNPDGSAKYWAIQASDSVPDASEELKGKIALATTAETLTGEEAGKAVTPATLQAKATDTIRSFDEIDADENPTDDDSVPKTYFASEKAVRDSLDSLETNIETTIKITGAHFIGEWVSLRNSTPPTGYYVRNGALISDASTTVPLLWAYLQESANQEQCISQAEWDAMQAETYTLSTGTTVSKWDGVGGVPYYVLDIEADTLRLPDTRGMFAEDAGFDDLIVGGTHEDMIRNITGTTYSNRFGHYTTGSASGSFYLTNPSNYAGSNDYNSNGFRLCIDTSRQLPTGNANKPRAFGMLPCIYAG